MEKLFKQACWLHLSFTVHRYLMCNAHGRWDGAEKAQRHDEMCRFYVAIVHEIEDVDLVRRTHEDAYQAVHSKTQALTDNLDSEINFPLSSRPDYKALAPLFFERFHDLAMGALAPAAAGALEQVTEC